MEEALLQQHLLNKPLDNVMSQDSDVLLMNPSLSYINQILMEEEGEGEDDAARMMPLDDLSYQATFSGFYEILAGKHPQPTSCVDSTCGDKASDAHLPHLGASEGLDNMPHSFRATNGHSCHHGRPEVGYTLKHDAGFQDHVMASHTAQFPQLHEIRNGMSDSSSCSKPSGLNEAHAPLSHGNDTAALNKHVAIILNNGELTDVGLSGCHKDATAAEGLGDQRCVQAQEQGNDIYKMPVTDEELSLKLAEVELSFEDLKLNNVYSELYAGELSSSVSSTGASRESKHISGDKKMVLAKGKGRKASEAGMLESGVFVDVQEVLVRCARAVAIGDVKTANKILQELREVHGASANGTSLQRLAHFFSMALEARMRGIGGHLFKAMSCKIPSAVTLFKATKVAYELIPYVKVVHYYANQSILKAAEGASRLHVVDFGLMYGFQWPCLISALADRKGGPPSLVITGIELPQTGVNPAKRLEKSGRQLASYAKTCNVPFQYHAIVSSKWEDLDAASLNLQKDEVLVVNCMKCLRHLADESVNLVDESVNLALTTCPRQKLLTFMRSLNPHLLLTAVGNAAYNSVFFISRFHEALHCSSTFFDMLDTLWGDAPQRHIMERSYFYHEILNVVGCEGAERVERRETYKQWHVRITKAGFEQLPILSTIVLRARSHVKQHYHKDFLIHDDGKGWMLVGWKGLTALGVSAWKPRLVGNCS